MSQTRNRRSIRLSNYDYRSPGAYFITISIEGRARLLKQREAHQQIERWWRDLKVKFPHVEPDTFIVMPNHVHGVIIIEDAPEAPPPHGQPPRAAATLSDIVAWFKTMTTNDTFGT